TVPDRDAERLNRKIDQIADGLPESAGGFLRWLKSPSSRLVRIPIALLLIVGGVAGFLPILGFWMIPLGLLFLAQDVPFLQRPILRALTWLQRKWVQWKRGLLGGLIIVARSPTHLRSEASAPRFLSDAPGARPAHVHSFTGLFRRYI